jgi:putative Mg2+ transporter-C (MgtC) family protein
MYCLDSTFTMSLVSWWSSFFVLCYTTPIGFTYICYHPCNTYRLVWAVILGCLIGWERRQADRPAGIRTMSLVALGSCLFSITSAFAFLSGPMEWDSSRVAAAIPSGVGFLGSALIFKSEDTKNKVHEVHGLTTAANVWLAAAVGIACAGEMYFVASFTTAIMLVLLRFGPRTYQPHMDDGEQEFPDLIDDETEVDAAIASFNAKHPYHSTDPETQSMLTQSQRSQRSLAKRTSKSRPSLL